MKKIKNMHGAKKAFAIIGTLLCAIIALFFLILLCVHLFTPVVLNGFFSNAEKEYLTPGIYNGLVPQGYAYVEENNIYLQCGHMADGESASRIYVTSAENTKESNYVELYTADGKAYTGHTGGITSANGFVWLANDGDGDDNCVWVISLEEILAAENGGKITLKTKIHPETRSAYCYADDEYLWIGEFRDNKKYPTVESHRFEVSGGTNHALVCAYPLDNASDYGIAADGDKITPEIILSVTDLVQGMTITPAGDIILSTSYGLSKSHLYFYSNVLENNADTTFEINGKEIPVYFLDADNLSKDVAMPPMSEEIFAKDGKVFVLFESACQKYIFGNFTRGRHIYSYNFAK